MSHHCVISIDFIYLQTYRPADPDVWMYMRCGSGQEVALDAFKHLRTQRYGEPVSCKSHNDPPDYQADRGHRSTSNISGGYLSLDPGCNRPSTECQNGSQRQLVYNRDAQLMQPVPFESLTVISAALAASSSAAASTLGSAGGSSGTAATGASASSGEFSSIAFSY